MQLSDMTKDKRSLLIYLETCAVDEGGLVDTRRMNDDDRRIISEWVEAGFVKYGRVRFSDIQKFHKPLTNWVELSEEAWRLAHEERHARYARISEHRTWQRSEEKVSTLQL